jgi:hypothetical protein
MVADGLELLPLEKSEPSIALPRQRNVWGARDQRWCLARGQLESMAQG